MRRTILALGTAFVAAVVAGAAAGQRGTGPDARFVREVPWAATGTWVAADTHVHTKFSDGGSTVGELLDKAVEYGCGAVAITDHADRKLTAATPAYRSAIELARAAHPRLIVAAGLEWNVPPWGGEEHMTLLLPPGRDDWATLAQFKDRFDDFQLSERPKPIAEAALRWLDTTTAGQQPRPVIIYNHPSRADAAGGSVDDIIRWRQVNDLVVGFEGAPGHQGREPLGAYSSKEKTIDRWDPVAARPGDAWDTLLQRGIDVTAALANSDFHNQNPRDLNDYWPCEFAESWLKVPETTVGGLLEALRAGTAFAAHGHIAREVELRVKAPGLVRPATVGEVIEVRRETIVTASVTLTIPALDWKREPNHIDSVELIIVRPSRVDVVTLPVSGTGQQSVSAPLTVGNDGLVVRARGRRIVPDGPDLMFYTNPIRVAVVQR